MCVRARVSVRVRWKNGLELLIWVEYIQQQHVSILSRIAVNFFSLLKLLSYQLSETVKVGALPYYHIIYYGIKICSLQNKLFKTTFQSAVGSCLHIFVICQLYMFCWLLQSLNLHVIICVYEISNIMSIIVLLLKIILFILIYV